MFFRFNFFLLIRFSFYFKFSSLHCFLWFLLNLSFWLIFPDFSWFILSFFFNFQNCVVLFYSVCILRSLFLSWSPFFFVFFFKRFKKDTIISFNCLIIFLFSSYVRRIFSIIIEIFKTIYNKIVINLLYTSCVHPTLYLLIQPS